MDWKHHLDEIRMLGMNSIYQIASKLLSRCYLQYSFICSLMVSSALGLDFWSDMLRVVWVLMVFSGEAAKHFSPHQGLILLWCTTRRCASLKNAVGPFAPESSDHALKGGETAKKAHLRALLTQLSGAGGTDACWCYGTGHMVSKRRGEGIFAGRMMSKYRVYT